MSDMQRRIVAAWLRGKMACFQLTEDAQQLAFTLFMESIASKPRILTGTTGSGYTVNEEVAKPLLEAFINELKANHTQLLAQIDEPITISKGPRFDPDKNTPARIRSAQRRIEREDADEHGDPRPRSR